MEDDEIIKYLKEKKSEVLYEMTKKYGGIVKSIATKVLGNNNIQDIEECIADTFVSMWKNSDKIDTQKGTLKSYITCSARNIAINRYHKLHKENIISLEILEEDIAETDINIIDKISLRYDMKTLNDLISNMNEPDREIFVRKYFLFEKIKEISKHLSIDEKTIENKLYRSKQRLKKELIERGVYI